MKKNTHLISNNQKQKAGLVISSVAFLLLLLGPASYKLYTQSILNVYASIDSLSALAAIA